MIKDVTNAVSRAISDRTNSPVIMSYFIPWVILNYEFVLVVLSLQPIDSKLVMLKGMVDKLNHSAPFCFSLIYLFGIPFVEVAVTIVKELVRNLNLYFKYKITKDFPLDKKDRQEYFGGYDEKIDEAKNLNSGLEKRLNEANSVYKIIIEGQQKRIDHFAATLFSDGLQPELGVPPHGSSYQNFWLGYIKSASNRSKDWQQRESSLKSSVYYSKLIAVIRHLYDELPREDSGEQKLTITANGEPGKLLSNKCEELRVNPFVVRELLIIMGVLKCKHLPSSNIELTLQLQQAENWMAFDAKSE